MADVTLFGPPQSTYLRTARIALEEKGVAYDLVPVEFKQPSHFALHPFGRVPILRHGAVQLYETIAIAHYVDDTFKGPSLFPGDAAARARAHQWANACCDYLFPMAIRELVVERFVKPMSGGVPDEAKIKANQPTLLQHFAVFDRALASSTWLAGEYSIADMYLGPIVAYMPSQPEGREIMARSPNIEAWFKRLSAKVTFAKTAPPAPAKAA